jgi:NADPH-dependent glutamate synthase beta subunit-like oxidoreductase/polyferredoxin
MFKARTLRKILPVVFILAVLAGAYFEIGWGTFSSFGYKEIAAICPLGSIETMLASRSVILPALIALIVFFLIALIGGRVFCGWICPISWVRSVFGLDKCKKAADGGCLKKSCTKNKAASEKAENASATTAQAEKTAAAAQPQAAPARTLKRGGLLRFPVKAEISTDPEKEGEPAVSKTPYWILGGTLVSTAFFGFPVFCLICPVGLFFAAVFGVWHLFAFRDPSWTLLFFIGMLLLELVFLRRWCHQFCPIGALLSLMARANRFFRPSVDKASCYNAAGLPCNLCQKVCPESLWMGKGLNSEETSRCTKCQRCADICPGKAITFPVSALKKTAAPAAVRSGRLNPEKASAEERKNNFHEIYKPFTLAQAKEQASRCMECGACEAACPQHNRIVERLHYLRQGDLQSAARSTLSVGSLPEVCGRVCPQSALCEGACPLASAGGAVPIGALSRFIADEGLKHGWNSSLRKAAAKKKSVAVVGAGPAGLACADKLNQAGFRVTVFEKESAVGGLMMWGIPPFKLEKELLSNRQSLYKKQGIQLELNNEVGVRTDWKVLLDTYDAVFVSTGLQNGVKLRAEADQASNVVQALDFLKAAVVPVVQSENTVWTADCLKGKKVVVLGGGDTAVDCARAAVRQKAESVKMICRKAKADMRAQATEVFSAIEEGVELLDKAVVDGWDIENGAVTGADILQDGSQQHIDADLVVVAYGFSAQKNSSLEALGVQWSAEGRPVTENYQSAVPKMFFGGDCLHGADLVVTAIADGKAAAQAISEFLTKKP